MFKRFETARVIHRSSELLVLKTPTGERSYDATQWLGTRPTSFLKVGQIVVLIYRRTESGAEYMDFSHTFDPTQIEEELAAQIANLIRETFTPKVRGPHVVTVGFDVPMPRGDFNLQVIRHLLQLELPTAHFLVPWYLKQAIEVTFDQAREGVQS